MSRYRRSSVALTAACALGAAAFIVLMVDLAHPVTRLNVTAICLVILAAVAYLRWLLIRVHETALKAALEELEHQRLQEQHVEQRLRGLRSTSDSDH